VMRTTVSSISKVGRSAQGVHIMNVGPGDRVASVAVIDLTKAPPAASSNGNGASSNGTGNGRRPRGTGRTRRR
jgi:hypothetical protein